MADKDNKNQPPESAKPATASATPRFDPKPVQVGGESLLDRLLPHMKKIVVGVIACAIVIGAVSVVVTIRDHGRASETNKTIAVLDVEAEPLRGPIAEPAAGSGSNAAQKPPEGFATEKDRAAATLDAIAKQGADVSPTVRGSLLVEAGKLDDAIAEYKHGIGVVGIDGVLAREGLGLAQEMKAEQDKDAAARQSGLEAALATFQSMQPDEKGPRRGYALYHQGRILGLLGKRDEAKAALQKAKDLSKDTDPDLVALVDARLATLGAS